MSIDGSRVLYSYLQKDLQRADVWLFQMVVAQLIAGLGIWLHPDAYQRIPLLRAYAARDPSCRGNKSKGIPDAWGSPSPNGILRDDNSLLKGLPKTLKVDAPKNQNYNGRKIVRGFTASHIWRETTSGDILASRDPLTYSFIPNLVWLPTEISRLTDREGSFVQQFVQMTSIGIYRDIEVSPAMKPIIDKAWAELPVPPSIPLEGVPKASDLNFFIPTEKWIAGRTDDLARVISAVELARSGKKSQAKKLPSRFREGLPSVDNVELEKLQEWLEAYSSACSDSALI